MPPSAWHLQDRWRTLRTFQQCYYCHIELAHQEYARYQVMVTNPDRDFIHFYSCFNCNDGKKSRRF